MGIDWDTNVLAPLEGVFAEPVTYSPAAGGASFTACGVFDEAYRDQDVIDGIVEANTTYPVIGVRLSQFTSIPVQNDSLLRQSNGKTYIVRDVRPDGHGWAKLKLGLA
jgi:hypothetical protein